MIVHKKPTFIELTYTWRLSILPRIVYQLASILVWSCVVIWANNHHFISLEGWTVAPFTLLGVALSIFLGFRNNACYDRWWEARRQLGAMVGEMRSFGHICASLSLPPAIRDALLHDAIQFTNSLMRSLRRPAGIDLLSGTDDTNELVLRRLGLGLAECLRSGNFGEPVYKLLEERIIAFSGFQATCERIQSTPTPFPYTLLVHRTAYAYCFLLPFGLAGSMHWFTPLFAGLVAYAFFGLDALGDELEDPFGDHANALPLLALARIIEISLLKAIDAEDIPRPLQPVDAILT